VELYSLLDSLGSTLTRATIESFFTRFDKTPEDVLTVDEAIICLEDELTKPRSEKREVDSINPYYSKAAQSDLATPNAESTLTLGDNVAGNGMSYTGPPITGEPEKGVEPKDTLASRRSSLGPNDALTAGSSSTSLSSSQRKPPSRQSSLAISDTGDTTFGEENNHELEKLINIKTCPLCHKKLTKKAEVDLVSHLAVCASQDWSSLSSLTGRYFSSLCKLNG
jgi:phosphatidylserine decarboxylase